MPGWWGWMAAVLGGMAGALAFDPLALRPLILLAPLGCFLAIRWAPSPRAALMRGWVFGWIYYFGALHWLLTVSRWAEPHVLGVFGVVMLGVYVGAYPALIGLVLRKWLWTPNAVLQFALFGSLWLLSEWLRTLGRLGMPLAQLGHAWATLPTAIQIAAWLGELGVSLEVLYGAGVFFLIGRAKKLKGVADAGAQREYRLLRRINPVLVIALHLVLVFLYFEKRAWDKRVDGALKEPGARRLDVGLLQPNIPQESKLRSYASPDENERATLQQWIRERTETMLKAHAQGQYQLILLPETAYTELDFNFNEPLRNYVSELVRRTGSDMLVSASRTISDVEFYNTAYFVHKDGNFDKAYYDKMRLVPFGESLPYFDMIPGMQSFVGIGSFAEGKTRTLFTSGGFKFGVLICFESTFATMGRALVREGADFLTVVTNDAWYSEGGRLEKNTGAVAHHDLSLLRAVETRRWLLRCANTGISSIITPGGKVQATLGVGRQGFVQGTIVPEAFTGRTLFVVMGNGWMLLPLVLVGVGVAVRRRARGKDKASQEI